MQLTNQKRLAAKILGCGVHRVWINSDYIDMVASAVQTEDIREFIDQGIIKAKPVKGTSRARARVRLAAVNGGLLVARRIQQHLRLHRRLARANLEPAAALWRRPECRSEEFVANVVAVHRRIGVGGVIGEVEDGRISL